MLVKVFEELFVATADLDDGSESVPLGIDKFNVILEPGCLPQDNRNKINTINKIFIFTLP